MNITKNNIFLLYSFNSSSSKNLNTKTNTNWYTGKVVLPLKMQLLSMDAINHVNWFNPTMFVPVQELDIHNHMLWSFLCSMIRDER